MDKHKEPKYFQELTCEKVTSVVRNICENWTNELLIAAESGRKNLTRKTGVVTQQCQELRLLLSTLPLESVESVVKASFNIFTSVIHTYNERRQPSLHTMKEQLLHFEICAVMLKSIMLPCFKRYDIKNQKSVFVQYLLFGLIHTVPNIEFLEPPLGINTISLVLNSLPFLTKLRELHYRFEFTNEVVFEMVKYCRKIHTIDAQFSNLNDSCITELLKCENLTILNVVDSGISEKGYATLLSNLHIKNIVWFDPIDKVLKHVTELPFVKIFVGTFSNPVLLTKKCPNITHLKLLSVPVSVYKLQDLNYVEVLKIYRSSYVSTNLGTFVHSLGSKLTELAFHQAAFVALDTIVNCCTSLKRLKFSYCHSTSLKYSNFNANSEHFKSVTDLRLKGNWEEYDFTSILHLYVNLESFLAINLQHVNDNSIENVIKKGGLKNLNKFTAESCGGLSIRTAWNLIQHSRNLIQMGKINSWKNMAPEGDLMLVKKFIRAHNLALELIS